MKKVETHKMFSLKWKEVLNGLLQAILIPVTVLIQQTIDSGDFGALNWKTLAMTAVGSGAIYIIRKYLASPKVVITTDTNAQAENLTENLKQ